MTNLLNKKSQELFNLIQLPKKIFVVSILIVLIFCIVCTQNIEYKFYLPKSLNVNSDIYLGKSISELSKNLLLEYDEYCKCYIYIDNNNKDYRKIILNNYIDDNIIRSTSIRYDKFDDSISVIKALQIIKLLTVEYGDNYKIYDNPTAHDSLTRPKLVWNYKDSVYISLLYTPISLKEQIIMRQHRILVHLTVEFSFIESDNSLNLFESTHWTRESLGLDTL